MYSKLEKYCQKIETVMFLDALRKIHPLKIGFLINTKSTIRSELTGVPQLGGRSHQATQGNWFGVGNKLR
jgi:hypothetical protein